jgi:hypothetical protein
VSDLTFEEVTDRRAVRFLPSVSHGPIDISKAVEQINFKPTSLVSIIIHTHTKTKVN